MPKGKDEDSKNFMAAAPQLLVDDVAATAEYYRDTLGFDMGPAERHGDGGPAYLALVRRDGFYIQLRRAAGRRGGSNRAYQAEACDIYFVVRNLETLFEELQSKNAKVILPPQSKDYPMREFEIEDCNGYVLTFGQPISKPAGKEPEQP